MLNGGFDEKIIELMLKGTKKIFSLWQSTMAIVNSLFTNDLPTKTFSQFV